jgi:hypothetical protein
MGRIRALLRIGRWACILAVALTTLGASAGGVAVGSAATGPHFVLRHATVSPGAAVRVVFVPAGVRTCRLTVGGPHHAAKRWTYHLPTRSVQFVLTPARNATAGTWRLTTSCPRPGQNSRTRSRIRVLVRGRGRGRGSLVGRHGPYLNVSLPQHPGIGFGGKDVQNPGFVDGQCTFWAFKQRPDIYWTSVSADRPQPAPRGGWDAYTWAQYAARGGYAEGAVPAVGSIMVNPSKGPGSVGHVAYVSKVIDSAHYVTTEMNTDGLSVAGKVFTVWNYDGASNNPGYPLSRPHRAGTIFIYGGPAEGAQYLGHLVQWDGDDKQQKTAWLVVNNNGHLERHWVPSSSIFNCLKTTGAPGPDVLSGPYLSQYLPDAVGVWAGCAGAGNGADQPPPPVTPPPVSTSAPPPTGGSPPPSGGTPPPVVTPPPSWFETAGGVAHTWTNYTNAGGTQGPSVNPSQTIQISCKLQGFRVADGNTWWYRIAQSPWDNQYFVSADAFYNNGATSGSLVGTPLVDPSVADC